MPPPSLYRTLVYVSTVSPILALQCETVSSFPATTTKVLAIQLLIYLNPYYDYRETQINSHIRNNRDCAHASYNSYFIYVLRTTLGHHVVFFLVLKFPFFKKLQSEQLSERMLFTKRKKKMVDTFWTTRHLFDTFSCDNLFAKEI